MNLKNKKLLKKLFEVGHKKKKKNSNIYNVAFFKKSAKKYTCRYHYQNLNDMIYSSWDIEQNIPKLAIFCHFGPFFPLLAP